MIKKIIGVIILVILAVGGIVLFMQRNSAPASKTVVQSPKPVAVAKTYTPGDVSLHASETDCWMIIEDKVYNATEFISKHPGGKAILNGCGKDATRLFEERPTNNQGPHPDAAKSALEKLYIGDLKK